ncbi:MAG: C39 family peptidase [Elusimicrobia bacterium]|nr:C39 family peptidase [Elusimicrobiota bacterium]
MSYTARHRTPLDLARAELSGLEPLPFAEGLAAARLARSSGTLTSDAIETPAPFDDLVASWNAALPAGSSLGMSVRVRGLPAPGVGGAGVPLRSERESGQGGWSPWFDLGEATETYSSPGRQENDFGAVDVDTLKLARPADAFQYRVRLSAGRKPATLKLVAVTVSDAAAPPEPPAFRPGPWVRELKLRPRSQFRERVEDKGDICSPTSLAMVLEWWGVRRSTARVAAMVRDHGAGIYGNWPFNIAAAAALGLEGWAARLDSIEDLQDEVAEGRPVVASLTFGPGEMDGAPLERTRGHLVVVSGFTPRGDVVVMDPAAPEVGGVRRVFDRLQFHRAWRVNKRGLAYLLGKPVRRRMTVGVPAAELRRRPEPSSELFTGILYGDRLTPLKAKGDWVQALADGQESFSTGTWQGYRGWVRAADLRYGPASRPDAVVASTRAALMAGGERLDLSMGTQVARLPAPGVIVAGVPPRSERENGLSSREDGVLVRLLDGRTGLLPARDLLPLEVPARTEAEVRGLVLRQAGLLLGAAYVWGGRSTVGPTPGVDCSGLSSLAYRVAGVRIPRDAHEQKLRSARVPPAELEPGDLIFLTKSARSRTVTHVMVFEGEDSIIESRQSAGKVVRTTFRERFGEPLAGLKDGGTVTDLTEKKRRRRKIFFGSFLGAR